jgi:heme-degrading monooxygenase HmoA
MAASEAIAVGGVRVLIWCQADSADRQRLVEAFEAIGAELRSVPGYLDSELLQSAGDSSVFAVLSAWTDWERFDHWEKSNHHPDQTSPLRPYQDRTRSRPFEIMVMVGASR